MTEGFNPKEARMLVERLTGMVPPLGWRHLYGNRWTATTHSGDTYDLNGILEFNDWRVSFNDPDRRESIIQRKTKGEAKAAADAHHVAQIMAAFGIV